MKVTGTKGIKNKLRQMHDDIDDDVDYIVKMNAHEGVEIAVRNAQTAFKKGYWTGNLARQIEVNKVAPLHYEVVSNAHYSGYLEYGTRYMAKEPFMFPTYQALKNSVHDDINRLLNG